MSPVAAEVLFVTIGCYVACGALYSCPSCTDNTYYCHGVCVVDEIQFLDKQQKWLSYCPCSAGHNCAQLLYVCYISEGVLIFCAGTDAQCGIRFLGLWEDFQKG